MKLLKILVLILVALLSILSGLTKVVQLPAEMELFDNAYFSPRMIVILGIIQALFGLLILFKKLRCISAIVLTIVFMIASIALFINKMWLFGLVSTLFFTGSFWFVDLDKIRMKKNRKYALISILSIVVLLGLLLPSRKSNLKTLTSEMSRTESWKVDFDHLKNNYARTNRSFTSETRTHFLEEIDNIESRIDELNDAEVVMKITKAVASADDGHTNAYLFQDTSYLNRVPLRYYWFNNELRVIKADSIYKKFLGYKVNKINNYSISKLLSALDEYIPGNSQWVKYKSLYFLTSPEALSGMDLRAIADKFDSKSLYMEFISKDQDTIKASIPASEPINLSGRYEAWRDLTINDTYSEPGINWSHINEEKPIPLYLSSPNKAAFYEYLENEKILFIQINSSTNTGLILKNFVEDIREVFKKYPIDHVVYDLRFNAGGNYLWTAKIEEEIPKLLPKDGKVVTITDMSTFSAGICAAARMKHFSKNNGVIVGQGIGDKLEFWAEGNTIQLPYSKLQIRRALLKHDWENNENSIFDAFFFNWVYGKAVKDVKPDYVIPFDFQNYLNGQDTYLDKAIEILQRN